MQSESVGACVLIAFTHKKQSPGYPHLMMVRHPITPQPLSGSTDRGGTGGSGEQSAVKIFQVFEIALKIHWFDKSSKIRS